MLFKKRCYKHGKVDNANNQYYWNQTSLTSPVSSELIAFNENDPVESFIYGFTRFNFGFAKKILLANPVGEIADLCFGAGDQSLSTPIAWIGACSYAFQIYFDFSAYSDMAIGLGRMFGFSFKENFNSPYKSASITEFWKRWHISLSGFLRDYLYIPLGGNRKGARRTYCNLLIVMLIGGLWHGAQWTFIAWGGIHGIFLVIERFTGPSKYLYKCPRALKIGITFTVLLFSWVFFRAENFERAFFYLKAMIGLSDTTSASLILMSQVTRPIVLFIIPISFICTFVLPNTGQILQRLTIEKVITGLFLMILALSMMFTQEFNPFLYFQF